MRRLYDLLADFNQPQPDLEEARNADGPVARGVGEEGERIVNRSTLRGVSFHRGVFLLAFVLTACVTATTDATPDINRLLDDWHRAAAEANEDRYFDAMAPEFVFLGTDGTERWNLAEFRAFAHPYFAGGKAWTFVPRDRQVIVSPRGDVAWFDEKLDSASYGECRGSGVARRVGNEWKVAHYNLSIPIPNALANEVVERIRKR